MVDWRRAWKTHLSPAMFGIVFFYSCGFWAIAKAISDSGVRDLPLWFQEWGLYLGDVFLAVGIIIGFAATTITGKKDALTVALGTAALSLIIPSMLGVFNMVAPGEAVVMDGLLGDVVGMSVLLSQALPIISVVSLLQKR